jgi:hypothetical protein
MTQHRRPRRSRNPPLAGRTQRGDTGSNATNRNPRTTEEEEQTPGPRKPLREMTPAELQAWLLEQSGELQDFCSYAQRWRKGRDRRGIYTGNDERYDQFLGKAPDLIRGLEELRELVEEAHQEEEHTHDQH